MQAIVLTRANMREHDQHIRVFSDEYGVLTVFARGVKKPTSKNSIALEPGTRADLQLVSKQADLAYLGSAVALRTIVHVRNDLRAMLVLDYGLRMIEQICVQPEPDPRLFELIETWILMLEAYPKYATDLLIWFLFLLLDHLGFSLQVSHCQVCGMEINYQTDTHIRSVVEDGGVLCEACQLIQRIHTREHVVPVSKELARMMKQVRRLGMLGAHECVFSDELRIAYYDHMLHALRVHTERPLGRMVFSTV